MNLAVDFRHLWNWLGGKDPAYVTREVLPPIGNQEGGEQTLIAENAQSQFFASSPTITASGA
jgi:hypothetical protein